MRDYRRTGHSVALLYAHLVFVTKYRRTVFNNTMLTDCEHTLVRRLKGASARRMRQDYTGRCNRARMHGHFWIPSCFAVSAGGAPLSIIKQYIENQARPL